jgi:hypothetical protein
MEFHATESYSRPDMAEAKYSIGELSMVETDHGYCNFIMMRITFTVNTYSKPFNIIASQWKIL